MDINTFLQPVLQNQVVTGLSFTALMGGAAYSLRYVPNIMSRAFRRFFTVELTVTSNDPAFEWMDRWLALQPYARKAKMMRLATITEDSRHHTTEPKQPEWILAPGFGTHIVWYRRYPIVLERSLLNKDSAEGGRSRGLSQKPLEELHMRTLGRSQTLLRALITDARKLIVTETAVPVRIWGEYTWFPVKGRTPRRLETIIVRDEQLERIIADIQWFQASREWYSERGIPYRRGYLFDGPPGTGKTSIVLALATHFEKTICVLNLNGVENDNNLFCAMREAPNDAIILIEDIDCAQSSKPRDENADDEAATPTGISQAGLLNALDGITTPDGRIFIMTTNYPDRLDAALIRAGRADVHETFDYFDAPEQRRMAARFYKRFEPLPFPVSPAEMQASFMKFPNDPEAARADLLDKAPARLPFAA
jgi:chaperone BCS1